MRLGPSARAARVVKGLGLDRAVGLPNHPMVNRATARREMRAIVIETQKQRKLQKDRIFGSCISCVEFAEYK